jgi:hypothetical protein
MNAPGYGTSWWSAGHGLELHMLHMIETDVMPDLKCSLLGFTKSTPVVFPPKKVHACGRIQHTAYAYSHFIYSVIYGKRNITKRRGQNASFFFLTDESGDLTPRSHG